MLIAILLQVTGGLLSGWRPELLSLQVWHEAALALMQRDPLAAALVVFLLHALLAAFALPGASLLMLLAGAGFGTVAGTLICLAGCTVGATATMLATRHWLRRPARRWLTRRFGGGLARFDARMARDGGRYLFSLRVLPVIPFALVNVAAGLTAIRVLTFTSVSFAGMAAGTFLYVNAGTELGHAASLSDLASPSLLLSLLALALFPWLAKIAHDALAGRRGSVA